MHRARLATLNALSMALLAVSIVLAAQGGASAVAPVAGNVVGWPSRPCSCRRSRPAAPRRLTSSSS